MADVELPVEFIEGPTAAAVSFCLSKLICCSRSFSKSCSVISGVISMLLVGAVDCLLVLLVDVVVTVDDFEAMLAPSLSRLSIDELKF